MQEAGGGGLEVRRVAAEEVRPLRHEVLRRGLPLASATLPGDDHPLAAHVAVLAIGAQSTAEIVSVGSVFPDPPPWAPDTSDAWRIRGMATTQAMRGRGFGSRVLEALCDHARSHGGGLIWCHARVGALGFYRRARFEVTADTFDDGIALHQSMWRALD
ncbi:MAG TPA: GNAT family N-acetyltransferase [Acidimicrobiales bacterium]|nr:GNAT family N-acetyltransferase [Acidimicrobiales bacterium]